MVDAVGAGYAETVPGSDSPGAMPSPSPGSDSPGGMPMRVVHFSGTGCSGTGCSVHFSGTGCSDVPSNFRLGYCIADPTQGKAYTYACTADGSVARITEYAGGSCSGQPQQIHEIPAGFCSPEPNPAYGSQSTMYSCEGQPDPSPLPGSGSVGGVVTYSAFGAAGCTGPTLQEVSFSLSFCNAYGGQGWMYKCNADNSAAIITAYTDASCSGQGQNYYQPINTCLTDDQSGSNFMYTCGGSSVGPSPDPSPGPQSRLCNQIELLALLPTLSTSCLIQLDSLARDWEQWCPCLLQLDPMVLMGLTCRATPDASATMDEDYLMCRTHYANINPSPSPGPDGPRGPVVNISQMSHVMTVQFFSSTTGCSASNPSSCVERASMKFSTYTGELALEPPCIPFPAQDPTGTVHIQTSCSRTADIAPGSSSQSGAAMAYYRDSCGDMQWSTVVETPGYPMTTGDYPVEVGELFQGLFQLPDGSKPMVNFTCTSAEAISCPSDLDRYSYCTDGGQDCCVALGEDASCSGGRAVVYTGNACMPTTGGRRLGHDSSGGGDSGSAGGFGPPNGDAPPGGSGSPGGSAGYSEYTCCQMLPPSPPPAASPPALASCVCGSDPASYSTFGSTVNCFGANDVTNLEVMFSGLAMGADTRAFYTRCSDYDNDGAFRANDLTNMKRYYAGLLGMATHLG